MTGDKQELHLCGERQLVSDREHVQLVHSDSVSVQHRAAESVHRESHRGRVPTQLPGRPGYVRGI